MQAVRLNSHVFDEVFEKRELSPGVVITFQVMAVSGMSPRHPYTVRPVSECRQDEFGTHPTGTGDSDDPDVRRILHAAHPREIRRAVTAPVAQKRDNFWFPIF